MVTLRNCTLVEATNIILDRKIIFFGAGSWIKTIDYTSFMTLQKQFAYVIDNNPRGPVRLGNVNLEVYRPDKLFSEVNYVIVLTSPVYMYDMFSQLEQMQLKDDVECLAFPFMQMITKNNIDRNLCNEIVTCNKQCIPKIIHSFWFSGEEKTEIYQNCIDTWKEKLGDYKIIEWNQDNYDCSKHPFFKKAIECKAWAFAADYARLDVLKKYGGFYLDMDVFVYKSFNDLLGNNVILSFSNNVQIDLAVMAAVKDAEIINKLMGIYDKVMIPKSREEFAAFFQPALVKPILAESGIRMDGSLQKVNNITVLPSEFFMPQEHILFGDANITENTYCNHLDNFGWSFNGKNKREKKINDNRLLWKKINN